MSNYSNKQAGGSLQLPARWFNNEATPFKGCNCPGSNCANSNYSCGLAQAGGQVQENFQLPSLAEAQRRLKETVGKVVPGLADDQEGGAINMPARFYHPNATPFKGCNCAGSGCSNPNYSCGLNGGGHMAGHATGQAIPKIQYGNSEPYNPQALTLSQKAHQHQGSTSFHYYNEYSQRPCNCFENQYKYYGDFNAQGCGTRVAGVGGNNGSQVGGNGPIGSPFVYFNKGQPLTQSYPMTEGPRFAPVPYSPYW